MSEEICPTPSHQWQETYYGYKCTECGAFVPFGSEPWIDIDGDCEDDSGEQSPHHTANQPTGEHHEHPDTTQTETRTR